jgi:23S rRNA (cytidine1920-2'-O)/16S rRNA (cytidine1409-2'-O)-methyltransferase
MRLDNYLVDTGLFKSRGRAKRAVEEGKVKLNGVPCLKPSKNITVDDVIDAEEGLDMPKGYFKLKSVQESFPILKEGDYVLDLGSSAGGFIMYASEVVGESGHVHGIEFSKDFRTELGKLAFENPHISIMFADVFTVPLENIATEKNSKDGLFDVLLNDMTLEPKDSVAALTRISPLVKEGGQLLQVIKIPKNHSKAALLKKIEKAGFEIKDVIEPEKQETYIIARKIKQLTEEEGEEEREPSEEELDADELGTNSIDITDMIFDDENESKE